MVQLWFQERNIRELMMRNRWIFETVFKKPKERRCLWLTLFLSRYQRYSFPTPSACTADKTVTFFYNRNDRTFDKRLWQWKAYYFKHSIKCDIGWENRSKRFTDAKKVSASSYSSTIKFETFMFGQFLFQKTDAAFKASQQWKNTAFSNHSLANTSFQFFIFCLDHRWNNFSKQTCFWTFCVLFK